MFKYYIRDLFWLILVFGLALGWWADRTRLANSLAIANHEADAYYLLTQRLFVELKSAQPKAKIEIVINGRQGIWHTSRFPDDEK